MNGQQCLGSILDLYDIGGGIRGQLIDLQDAVTRAQSTNSEAK